MSVSPLDMVLAIGLLMLLAWAAVTDLKWRIIPNTVPVLVIALYGVRVGTNWPDAALVGDLAVAAAALVIGFIMFARGWLGGGDAKLIAALALWAGPLHMLPMAFVISLSGGVMAGVMLLTAVVTRPQTAGNSAGGVAAGGGDDGAAMTPVMRRPIPYAVAIAAGGLYLMLQHPAILASTGLGG